MKNLLTGLWANSQKRLISTTDKLTKENLRLRLNPTTSSLGFLMLHIGESQLLLAQLFFDIGSQTEYTFGYSAADDGREISLDLTRKAIVDSEKLIHDYIQTLPEDKWSEEIETRFGKLSRFDALAFIVHHSSYHLGQAGLTLKRGV